MAKIFGAVEINRNRCKGCDLCVEACPCDVLALHKREVNERGYLFAHVVNPDACIGCGACAAVCPDSCIEVYRFVESLPRAEFKNNIVKEAKIA
ncbi:MAG: 4Fe-4S binding protein [Muribaculaceae bacterium]|nr:4Fe-4S binding protein [Muribaculaceae bacterium]